MTLHTTVLPDRTPLGKEQGAEMRLNLIKEDGWLFIEFEACRNAHHDRVRVGRCGAGEAVQQLMFLIEAIRRA